MKISPSNLADFKVVSSVNIETVDYCNRKCPWCPNHERTQSIYDVMQQPIFEHIIAELVRLDYKNEVHPYIRNEPMCDPFIHDRISIIRKALPHCKILITSNGDFFKTEEDIKRLLEAGASEIRVSHYDEEYADLGIVVDSLFPTVYHIGLKILKKSFYNRGGNVDIPAIVKLPVCPLPFGKINILWNGNCVLCCSDWKETVVVGNVMDTPLDQIYESELMTRYRDALFNGTAKNLPLCDRCNLIP